MDIPTLENSVRALEHSIGVVTWWLLASTFAVALGLVLEYWHPVVEFIEEMKWPMAGFRWPKFMEIVGGILVTIGVIGEFGFTLEVFVLEGRLEKANREVRDVLTSGLADAASSVKAAHAELDALKSDASAIQKRLDAVTQQLGRTEASTRKAMQKARDAEEYATPRSITNEQALLIRKRIQSLKGHKLVLFGNFHDTEISDFANRLGEILDAGIMDVSTGVWPTGAVTEPGLKFGYGKARKADFDLLVNTLDEAGVEKADVLRQKSSTVGWSDEMLTITFGAKH